MKHSVAILLVMNVAVAVAQPASQAEIRKDRALFQAKCASCHSVACNRLGPKLDGIIGRTAGASDFAGYSEALRKSGVVWGEATLDAFLRDGSKLVPGNSMSAAVAPIATARERRSLIAHMRRQDRSIDLC